ncbi:TPA: SWIM zinc finger family protein, partial [Staphylococcus aureus]|nr:SWIM zinc finger family protein [Staphylococcus aureus]HDP4264762.1 SWIM zinc finger family protein [Staphylococcus aureus]
NMWIDSLKEMINDMSEEELRDAYLNMLIEHGEMAELFGLDEEEEMFEDEFY